MSFQLLLGDATRLMRDMGRDPDVWNFASTGFKGDHYATFPAELARRCILAGSRPGDTVLDPFCGTGTLLAEAERLGRNSIGIDISERSIAWSRERLANAQPPMEGFYEA